MSCVTALLPRGRPLCRDRAEVLQRGPRGGGGAYGCVAASKCFRGFRDLAPMEERGRGSCSRARHSLLQGNPCSTGIRWGVSPAAQMGCLRNRSGSPSVADQP